MSETGYHVLGLTEDEEVPPLMLAVQRPNGAATFFEADYKTCFAIVNLLNEIGYQKREWNVREVEE